MSNPYPYTLDNKRYYTFNYYGKTYFGKKIYKVPLDGPFTCPNRDGKISHEGCIFCSGGSNAFPNLSDCDLVKQYHQRKAIYTNKWPDGYPYAYFQSFSNTYANLETLKQIYQPFVEDKEVYGLVIATRCDCLDQEKIDYLNSLTKIKPVWLELGLQSIHEQTLKEMNRGHTYQDFLNVIRLLENTDIKISVHLINGWPTETKDMMIESAKEVGKLPIHAIKFHMLHICKGTPLALKYAKENFSLLTKQQYVEIVGKQLTYLRNDIIIERLTGDALKEELIAPEWTLKKISVINDIDKYMESNDFVQGLNYAK